MVLKKGLYPSFFCSPKALKIAHFQVFWCRDESAQLHGWAGTERQGQVEQGNSRWIDPWVNTCVCLFQIFVLKPAAAREQEKPNVVTSHGRIFQSYVFRNKLYSVSLHMAAPSMLPLHHLALLLLSKILLLWLAARLLLLLLAASKKRHYFLQMEGWDQENIPAKSRALSFHLLCSSGAKHLVRP